MDRILPEYDVVHEQEMREAVYQALGFASVCWEPMDCTGVFESEKASQVAEELLGVIQQFSPSFHVIRVKSEEQDG